MRQRRLRAGCGSAAQEFTDSSCLQVVSKVGACPVRPRKKILAAQIALTFYKAVGYFVCCFFVFLFSDIFEWVNMTRNCWVNAIVGWGDSGERVYITDISNINSPLADKHESMQKRQSLRWLLPPLPLPRLKQTEKEIMLM